MLFIYLNCAPHGVSPRLELSSIAYHYTDNYFKVLVWLSLISSILVKFDTSWQHQCRRNRINGRASE